MNSEDHCVWGCVRVCVFMGLLACVYVCLCVCVFGYAAGVFVFVSWCPCVHICVKVLMVGHVPNHALCLSHTHARNRHHALCLPTDASMDSDAGAAMEHGCAAAALRLWGEEEEEEEGIKKSERG